MTVPVCTVVTIDDWAALYRDDKSIYQGHSVPLHEVVSAMNREPFIFASAIGADGTPLEVWAHDHGDLPDSLAEAKRIAGL